MRLRLRLRLVEVGLENEERKRKERMRMRKRRRIRGISWFDMVWSVAGWSLLFFYLPSFFILFYFLLWIWLLLLLVPQTYVFCAVVTIVIFFTLKKFFLEGPSNFSPLHLSCHISMLKPVLPVRPREDRQPAANTTVKRKEKTDAEVG